VDSANVEANYVAPIGRAGHRVFQFVLVGWQVRVAGAILSSHDVLKRTLLVGTLQKADLAVFMTRVVEMNQNVHVSVILVFVERPILVHRKGVSGLGWLDVHGGVV
jgi:hypothetical protein